LVAGVLGLLLVAGAGAFFVWRQRTTPPADTTTTPLPPPLPTLPATRIASGSAVTQAPKAVSTPGLSSVRPKSPAPVAARPTAGAKDPAAGEKRSAMPAPPPPVIAAPEVDPVVEAVDQAGTALRAGQFDHALSTLQAALGAKPDSPHAPEANLLIARVYERQNRPEAAMAAYAEVRNRYPHNAVSAEALVRLADLVQRTKDSNRAQTAVLYLTLAVTNFPDTAIAPLALSTRAGIEEREKMKVTDPTLGRVVPAALVSYRQLTERYPTAGVSEVGLSKLAAYYEDLKRFDLAAQALAELGTRFPATRFDAWWDAADLYEKKLKDKDKAKDAYSRVPPTSRHYRDAQKKVQ
jgi:TolA-binding protein